MGRKLFFLVIFLLFLSLVWELASSFESGRNLLNISPHPAEYRVSFANRASGYLDVSLNISGFSEKGFVEIPLETIDELYDHPQKIENLQVTTGAEPRRIIRIPFTRRKFIYLEERDRHVLVRYSIDPVWSGDGTKEKLSFVTEVEGNVRMESTLMMPEETRMIVDFRLPEDWTMNIPWSEIRPGVYAVDTGDKQEDSTYAVLSN